MKRNILVRVFVTLAVLLLSTTAARATSLSRSAQADTSDTVGLKVVAEGLNSPIALVASPDLSGRRFIVDQIGVIRILTSEGKLLDQPFLDLRDRLVTLNPGYDERGLLGLAFHPGFGANGRFYVYYSAPLRPNGPKDWDHTNRLSEFKVFKDNPNRADPASERILLRMDHPYLNHNGGTVAFGPDNYLYLSVGDGGNKNDIGRGHTPGIGNGQDISKLLGKILRFDVDRGGGAPARENPFINKEGRNEIFAYGFRNPYRFSFDMGGSHQLFVGDAGQDLYEEVSIVTIGGNYGWNIKEGTHCFNPQDEEHPPEQCRNTGSMGEPLIDPVIEYNHPDEEEEAAAATTAEDEESEIVGEVVVGGYVYRGEALPQFGGQYIFGDWSREEDEPDGSILIAHPNENSEGLWEIRQLAIAGSADGRLHHFVVGFGQDAVGEMYVLVKDTVGPTGETGKVYKLTSEPSA